MERKRAEAILEAYTKSQIKCGSCGCCEFRDILKGLILDEMAKSSTITWPYTSITSPGVTYTTGNGNPLTTYANVTCKS